VSHASHTSHAAAEFKCAALALAGFKADCKREALKATFKHLSDRSIHKKKRLARDGGI